MHPNQNLITTINILLMILSGMLGLYFSYYMDTSAALFMYVISLLALIFAIISYKRKLLPYIHYMTMLLGSSFNIIIYLSDTEFYLGAIWMYHTLVFSYFILGFKDALRWNTAYLSIFFLIHIYFYFNPHYLPYDWHFILGNLFSLSTTYIALYMYGLSVEKLRLDKEKAKHDLEISLENTKRAQKQLVESEKMSALGSLVAGVAHEINTPIGISLTGTTHIEHETKKIYSSLQESNLSEKALVEYLDTVTIMSKSMHLSLETAAKLVSSFKQVAVDQHVEEKRVFDFKEYIDRVLLSLHNKLKHTKIKLTNKIDNGIIINSYAGTYSQVLTNFIMNSLSHGFEDNSKGNITIDAYIKEGNLFFLYEDDGKGISEEIIENIFDPFFTTKRGRGGTGLGLNIIYNLVNHKLKGEIKCESVEGEGTKMIIQIPMKHL